MPKHTYWNLYCTNHICDESLIISSFNVLQSSEPKNSYAVAYPSRFSFFPQKISQNFTLAWPLSLCMHVFFFWRLIFIKTFQQNIQISFQRNISISHAHFLDLCTLSLNHVVTITYSMGAVGSKWLLVSTAQLGRSQLECWRTLQKKAVLSVLWAFCRARNSLVNMKS